MSSTLHKVSYYVCYHTGAVQTSPFFYRLTDDRLEVFSSHLKIYEEAFFKTLENAKRAGVVIEEISYKRALLLGVD